MIKKPSNSQTEGVHELFMLAFIGMKLALFEIYNKLFFQNSCLPFHSDSRRLYIVDHLFESKLLPVESIP